MPVLNYKTVAELGTENIHAKILAYGDSGAGKTFLGCTAPNPCVLLTEPNGMLTIAAANPQAVVVQANTLQTVHDFMRDAMDGSLREATGCDTIVIDSLTELQRMLRDDIMAAKGGSGNANVRWTLDDWSTLTDRMRKLLRMIRDLPFHVVAIALAEVNTDENDARYVVPAFQGKKLANEVAGYFSMVTYVYRQMETQEDGTTELQHRALMRGPSTYITKTVPGLESLEICDVSDWLERTSSAPVSAQVSTGPTKGEKKSRRRRNNSTSGNPAQQ